MKTVSGTEQDDYSVGRPSCHFHHHDYLLSIVKEQKTRSKFSVFQRANQWMSTGKDAHLRHSIYRTTRKVIKLDPNERNKGRIKEFVHQMDRLDRKNTSNDQFTRKKVILDLSVDELDSTYLNPDKKVDYLSLIQEDEEEISFSERDWDGIEVEISSKDGSKEIKAKKLLKLRKVRKKQKNKRKVRIERIYGDPISLKTVYIERVFN